MSKKLKILTAICGKRVTCSSMLVNKPSNFHSLMFEVKKATKILWYENLPGMTEVMSNLHHNKDHVLLKLFSACGYIVDSDR